MCMVRYSLISATLYKENILVANNSNSLAFLSWKGTLNPRIYPFKNMEFIVDPLASIIQLETNYSHSLISFLMTDGRVYFATVSNGVWAGKCIYESEDVNSAAKVIAFNNIFSLFSIGDDRYA